MITSLIITAVAVFLTAQLLPGVTCEPWYAAILVAIVLGLINTFIKPIVKVLSLPINIVTLGLFSLVINAAMVMLCDYFVGAFSVDGFMSALIFSVVLAVVNWVLSLIFD